jgi:hypothetical protein
MWAFTIKAADVADFAEVAKIVETAAAAKSKSTTHCRKGPCGARC